MNINAQNKDLKHSPEVADLRKELAQVLWELRRIKRLPKPDWRREITSHICDVLAGRND